MGKEEGQGGRLRRKGNREERERGGEEEEVDLGGKKKEKILCLLSVFCDFFSFFALNHF